MKIADLSRYRRLLALCGISAALHLLLLDLVARHRIDLPAPRLGAAEPLVLRLAPAGATATPDAPAAPQMAAPPPAPVSSAVAAAPVAAMLDSTARPSAPAPAPTAPASAPEVGARASLAAPIASLATPAPADAAAGAPVMAGPSALRARYRTRPPPGVKLLYTLTPANAAPGAPAHNPFLDWRPAGGAYTLDMDGVLGRLSSRGLIGDDGILPSRALERVGERELAILFDAEHHRVVLADGSEAPDEPGMQDRASLLVRLASIGAGRPGQLQGGIEITVADASGVHPESFQVVGEEDIDTGLGRTRAWHLAQLAPPGEARLDAWLAPERDWLPVQLRLTRPDGSTATQVLLRAEPNGAP